MNLHLLRIFVAVVEHGSFSRAAAALFISQPAVSKAVIELENQLGLTLIERGARKLDLTEAGALLHERSKLIFSLERAAEDELLALRGLKKGILRIGASTTVATYLLPPLLTRFHREHPGVELRLTSANTLEIVQALREYSLDIALVEGPVSDPQIEVTPWLDDEVVLISAPDHPLANRAGLRAQELADQTFIIREQGSGTRVVVEEALRQKGVMLQATIELGSTEAIKQAVAAGLGLSIVSKAAAADQLALGKLRVLPISDLVIHRSFTRLTLTGRTPSANATAFDVLLSTAVEKSL